MIQKWSMYECITKSPVIAWAPGRFEAGKRHDELCQLFDLGPTILELAGVEMPESFEARSLLPLLEGRDWQPREHVFCEQMGDHNLTGCELITMVRDRRMKLVHFKDADYGQLFDLEADPGEVRNLWHDPAHAATKERLLAVLRDWLIDSHYRTRDRLAEFR